MADYRSRQEKLNESPHAAAFALVVWYLLLPSLIRHGQRIDNIQDVPMSRWERESFNANKTEYEAAEARFHALAERSETWSKLPTVDYTPRYTRWSNAICVSSDDPRLKER